MPPFALPLDALAESVLVLSVKGTLLLTLALGVALAFRRGAAATRHAVWVTALAGLLVLPLASVALPGWYVEVAPAGGARVEVAAPEGGGLALDEAPLAGSLPDPAPALQGSDAAPVWERAEAVALTGVATVRAYAASLAGRLLAEGWGLAGLVWILGMVWVAARWGGALFGAARIVGAAEPVTEEGWLEAAREAARAQGVRGSVRLLRSERLAVPVAWSLARPAVVLPADADTWDAERRHVVLAHEMAHVARRDGWSQLLAQVAVLMHWFNPLAWVAYHRVLEEREQACDDRVLMRGARPSAYAQHLVELARRYRPEPLSVLALAPMARPTGLEARIRSILDPGHCRARISRRGLFGTAVLGLALVVPLAAFRPAATAPPGGATPPVPPAAPEAPEAPAPPAAPEADQASDWTWSGVVRSGGTVEVFGTNGNVSASRASESRVEASAVRRQGRPARGNPDDVQIVVREHARGVTICAVWPGQRGCEPGRGPSGRVDNNNVSVNFTIQIPDGVALSGSTTNGNVRAEGLAAPLTLRTTNGNVAGETRSGDVEAHTTNGNVSARAAGVVRAGTTNGNVSAHFGRTDWTGSVRIATTNGNVTVTLPANGDLDLDLRARTGTGSIRSDLPVTVRRTGYVGAEAEGRIGRGGRQLEVAAQNGNVRIQRPGGRVGALPERTRTATVVRREHDATALAHLSQEAALGALEAVDWDGLPGVIAEAIGLAAESVAAVDWKAINAEISAALAEAQEEIRQARLEQAEARLELEAAQELSNAERIEAERGLREAERALREAERALRNARSPRP